MIEKYLKDSITDKPRLALIESLSKTNLIPPRINVELRRLDSLDHAKDSAYLIQKGFIKIIKDTLDSEDEPELVKDDEVKSKLPLPSGKEKRDSSKVKSAEAILPDKKTRAAPKDTVKN